MRALQFDESFILSHIFLCLSVVFLVKKKIFAYVFITGCWSLVAIANGIVLSDRKTPFTAVDLTL